LTIRGLEAAGLSWPLSDDITDTELEARLFASAGAGPGTRPGHRRQAEPDWAAVHRELQRKHVTLSILSEEDIAGEPGDFFSCRSFGNGLRFRRGSGSGLCANAHGAPFWMIDFERICLSHQIA
jgi:hypothetical protein